MKKLISFAVCLCLVLLSSIVFVGCDDTSTSNTTSETSQNKIIDSNTKDYYEKNNYVSFSVDKQICVVCDENSIVDFDDGTSKIKKDTEIQLSIEAQQQNKSSNLCFKTSHIADYKTKSLIYGYRLNGKFYDLSFNNKIKVKQNTTITLEKESFETLGIALLLDYETVDSKISNENIDTLLTKSNGHLSTLKDNLFYVKFNSAPTVQNINSLTTETNCTNSFNFKNNNDCYTLNMKFEVPFETTKCYAFLILETGSENIYLDYLSSSNKVDDNTGNFEIIKTEKKPSEFYNINIFQTTMFSAIYD